MARFVAFDGAALEEVLGAKATYSEEIAVHILPFDRYPCDVVLLRRILLHLIRQPSKF